MKLTHPLLLNAKLQDKRYKLRDRDSMYLLVPVVGSVTAHARSLRFFPVARQQPKKGPQPLSIGIA